MYAQIIPLVRMPRRFAFFDYQIPEHVHASVGDLVRMPLKGRIVPGVIRGINTKSDFKKVQKIESVVHPKFMNKKDVQRLECIAEQILQSPSSVFTAALQGITHSRSTAQQIPHTKSGSLDKDTVHAIKKLSQELESQNQISLESSFEGCIAAIRLITSKAQKQILILCPRERDIEMIARYLPMPHARLHGHTPLAKRRWVLESWKSKKISVLIGTRQASLIPAQDIEMIIVYDPHSEDHVSYSRNPRYDARLAAKLLAKQHGAKILTCGPIAPLIETTVIQSPQTKAQLINLKDKREKIGIPLVSETAKNAIEQSLQNGKNVLISYNSKGVAKRLACRNCHHVPLCGTCGSQPHVRLNDLVCPVCHAEMWIPEACPSCGKKTLTTRGIGNKRIAAELQKHFSHVSIEVVDKEHSQASSARIQIVTEHYFQSVYTPFHREFGLILELMAEKSLGADYTSSITTAYRLNRLMHMAHQQKAKCLIQTWMPDVIKPMLNAHTFREQETRLRRQYKLPPFMDQFELSGSVEEVQTIDPKQRKDILKKLKEQPDSVTIQTTYSTYDTPNCHNA